MAIRFAALEHTADGGFAPVELRFDGAPADGWQVERNGDAHLALGPGYRLLATRACGVCATDLARRFLPFPLPQVIGHELLAEGDSGERCVVEINASCRARGLAPCPTCAAGAPRHCPERRVLGIHDLPGGFGPFVLAPVKAAWPVPAGLPDETAALVEPFAAALHAVRTVAPRPDERIAVLGPRRLGMLIVAALAAERRAGGASFEIVAVVRRPELGALACELGADGFEAAEGLPDAFADVVIDTTGAPEGLTLALAAARREVHLKSTHGQPAGGLRHATELVVDELRLAPWEGELASGPTAWLAPGSPAPGCEAPGDGGARYAAAVVADAEAADRAIRPDPGRESSRLRPRGTLLVHPSAADADAPALREVARRGLILSTSRCGDFGEALALLEADPALAGLGPRLVTHRFSAAELPAAFAAAASREALKVLVTHPRP